MSSKGRGLGRASPEGGRSTTGQNDLRTTVRARHAEGSRGGGFCCPAVLRSCCRRPVGGECFPGGRPVDRIDRIDAIDEVGCGGSECAMLNAQCGMGERAAIGQGTACPEVRPVDETTKSTKSTNRRRKAHGRPSGTHAGRPGEWRTASPRVFRAGFVDVVGIVDVVERPGIGEGFPEERPVDDRTKRPQDNSSRPARRRIEGRGILLSCRPEILLSTASWRGCFPGGRPVDEIDRIDAIDEVGRGGVMRNAQCAMRNGRGCGQAPGGRGRCSRQCPP